MISSCPTPWPECWPLPRGDLEPYVVVEVWRRSLYVPASPPWRNRGLESRVHGGPHRPSNSFNFSAGAGFRDAEDPAKPDDKPVLDFDAQLARAAFFDLGTRVGSNCFISGGTLVMTNDDLTLRAELTTGRLLEIRGHTDGLTYELRFRGHVWDQAHREFERRAAPLTNHYAPGHGLSSLASCVATELARWRFTDGSTSVASAGQPCAHWSRSESC